MLPIITIARQYGSGGHEVGERLAEKLNVPLLDKQLIAMAAKKSGLSEEVFEKADEKAGNSLLYSIRGLTWKKALVLAFALQHGNGSVNKFFARLDQQGADATQGVFATILTCAKQSLTEAVHKFILANAERQRALRNMI